MNRISKLWTTLRGFTSTIIRYSIAILFFLFSAIFTSYNINTNGLNNIVEILFAFALGSALYMVLQMVYERFYHGKKIRLIFAGVSIIVAALYYLLFELGIMFFTSDHALRTVILLFILLISFIWVPVIKSELGFADSFMVVFKAFFIVMLYSGVLFLGISLIIMAIDMLIINVDSKAYAHVGNFIAYIYAPIHLLSMIPIYPRYFGRLSLGQDGSWGENRKDTESDDSSSPNSVKVDNELTQLNRAIRPSKFLEGLVSFIIIPVTAIFTVILLLYIIMNITGDFWKDNLMEPLLVTYSITVIIVYLLASVISNKPADYFRRIFPKVLIPVVLFQTISSVLKIGEQGITSGRYYVIMFGIFATISAVIFSIRPNRKSNIIAPILIILSLASILPPVDAFTISKRNQISRLADVLDKNDMLKDDRIVANAANLTEKDRQIIISSVSYLSRMDYLKDISWLKEYSETYNFEKIFGFDQYGTDTKIPEVWHLYLSQRVPLEISDYDIFVELDLYGNAYRDTYELISFGNNGYSLEHETKDGIGDLVIRDDQENELIRYSLDDIFNRFRDSDTTNYGEISKDDAEFYAENDKASIYIVVQSLSFEKGEINDHQNINAYVMLKLK